MHTFEPGKRLRDLTGLEEEWIARDGAFGSIPAACHELLARCLGTGGETERETLEVVRSLHLAARDRLLLELRKRSFGPQIHGEIRCPQCGTTSAVEFTAPDLPIEAAAMAAATEVPLPGGHVAVLRPLTAGDHEEFALANNLDSTGQWRIALARAVTSIDGLPAAESWGQLTDADFAALKQALKAANPEEVRLDLRCNHCEQALSTPFDVCSFFLRN